MTQICGPLFYLDPLIHSNHIALQMRMSLKMRPWMPHTDHTLTKLIKQEKWKCIREPGTCILED